MIDSDQLIAIVERLRVECDGLSFAPPVATVYNPLAYAWDPLVEYLGRYHGRQPKVALIGMNPGPFGMMQTGVPFGDVVMVRDWLGIEAPVGQPERLHPKRPVSGFACHRREVSGSRVWGWAQERFGAPDRFLAQFFVINYCPLLFFEESGTNRTPDKLRRDEQRALFEVCDRALAAMMRVVQPQAAVGIGRFAEERARLALAEQSIHVCGVTHPSPANPKANRGWMPHMDEVAFSLGVELPHA